VIASDSVQRYQAVVAGGQHSCAISTAMLGSKVYCWGYNPLGQLGNGTTGRDSIPRPIVGSVAFSGRAMDVNTTVAGTATAMTIAAGYDHSCALDTVGLAWCWGSNALGQLGTATLSYGPGVISAGPVDVANGISFVQITAGENHTCGLTGGGQIYCWGSNARGQLGNSDVGAGGAQSVSPTPVLVTAPGLVFMAVSAGDQHTCALTIDNRALCWGDNQYGQLGDNREHETPLTSSFLPRWQPRAVKFQPQ
jgi:alpha-tubulin suppressor-like RCC1 family protein